MPNSFAYLMLLAWPVIAVGLFRLLSVERAVIWTILGGYLLLPPVANFDFPVVPAFDKTSIPNLAAFLICVVMLGKRVPLLPGSPTGRVLMVLFVVSPFATALTNGEPIPFDVGGLPGLRIYDSVAAVINQAIYVLPFFLAQRFLASEAAQREILLALMLAGLAYSVPMLIEVRLSPQLNTWIYGFFQHSFAQMMREGGFRPIVFLYHGLWVAFFAMTALVATVGLWRAASPHRRTPYFLAAGYLAVVLVLCKSLGSMLYAAALVPIVALTGRKTQIRIAAGLALIAVLFPLLRGADLVPVETMLTRAEAIDEERAASLQYRFDNEDLLLARAGEKLLFGWGGWGRNQIYDPTDGKMLSVTDGRWIIVIGIYGWLGYIVEFGLLSLPLFLLAWRTRRMPAAALSPHMGPLALILGINMIDMLPNATLIPFTWLIAGAMLGHAEALAARRPADAALEREAAGRDADRHGPVPERPRTIL